MLGIIAYMISIMLLYDFVGGFSKGQWAWIIIVFIVGFAWEFAGGCKNAN